MKRFLVLVLLFGFGLAPTSFAQSIYASVTLDPTGTQLQSNGSAQFYNSHGDAAATQMTGDHSIVGADGSVAGANSIATPQGHWFGTLIAQGKNGVCYRGGVNVTAGGISQGMGSRRLCYPNPAQPQPDPGPPQYPVTSCTDEIGCTTGGPHGGGGIQTLASDQCYYDVWYGSVCNSPLLINLGDGPYALSGADSPVAFDLNASGGAPELVTWTAAGKELAFLAIDRNNNGRIDDGSELFGNNTPLRSGATAANGFIALRDFDANGDHIINSSDPIWPYLRLWTDRNHDGISQVDEITTPTAAHINSLGYDYIYMPFRDRYGNLLRYASFYSRDGRLNCYFDVFFRLVRR